MTDSDCTMNHSPKLIDTFRSLFHYNPITGTITYLQPRGPRSAGDPAGGTNQRMPMIYVHGKHYPSAFIAWVVHYGAIPSPQHVIPIDGNPFNLSLINLALSNEPFILPAKPQGRRAGRPKWHDCVRYSGRAQCWKAYHYGKLLGTYETKQLAIQAKREAMKVRRKVDA